MSKLPSSFQGIILICAIAIAFTVISNTLSLDSNIKTGIIYSCIFVICCGFCAAFWKHSWIGVVVAFVLAIVFLVLARNAFASNNQAMPSSLLPQMQNTLLLW